MDNIKKFEEFGQNQVYQMILTKNKKLLFPNEIDYMNPIFVVSDDFLDTYIFPGEYHGKYFNFEMKRDKSNINKRALTLEIDNQKITFFIESPRYEYVGGYQLPSKFFYRLNLVDLRKLDDLYLKTKTVLVGSTPNFPYRKEILNA